MRKFVFCNSCGSHFTGAHSKSACDRYRRETGIRVGRKIIARHLAPSSLRSVGIDRYLENWCETAETRDQWHA